MADREERLIRRIQRELQSLPAGGTPRSLAPDEAAELESRVRRLRGLGRAWAHVRLSRYITLRNVIGTPGRVRGGFVTTDA